MSKTWSTKIQGINTLNLNREVRFTDKVFGKIIETINPKSNTCLLELGCGPGTFTRKFASIQSESSVTGLDYDSNFIEFCVSEAEKLNLTNVNYQQGDALKTPFENDSFDICTSHTVIEHLPNKEFLEEQFRILKPGGTIAVLNVKADKSIRSIKSLEPSSREEELMKKIGSVLEELQDSNKVAQYSANPQEIMETMEQVGFKDLQIDAIPYVTCIDDARNDYEYKMKVIDSEKKSILDFIKMAINKNPEILSERELIELEELISDRYENRISLIDNEKYVWDLSVVPLIAMIGKKPRC